jgi:oligopeptide transport system substrate-binding protein
VSCIAILPKVLRVLLPFTSWLVLIAACAPPQAALMVANGDDVGVLHPQLATTSAEGRVMLALHAGLTRLDSATLKPEPNLASTFHSELGGKKWRFQIRPNLHWSDGEPLLATDFLRSWQQLMDPNFGAPYSEWLQGAKLRLDGDWLHVEFPSPRPEFAEMCAYQALAPVPAHTTPELACSGPYQIVSRRIRDRIVVEKNPWFWQADLVQIERIHFLTIESQFTALNLFLTGDIDYAPAVPALAIPRLSEEYSDEFQPSPQWATYFLRFNTQRPPFNELRHRRAFSAALQPAAIANGVGGGRQPAFGLVPPGIDGWRLMEASKSSESNQAKVQKAIQPAAKTSALQVEYLYNSSELNRDVAEVLQQQWQTELGITVRLANQEWKTFLASQKGLDYQISRSSWVGDYLDPMTFLEIFQSNSGNNRTGWKNREYDGLLQSAREATDRGLRLHLMQQAEVLLLDQAVIMPLFYENSFELVAKRVLGFQRNLRGYVDWSRLRLEVTP